MDESLLSPLRVVVAEDDEATIARLRVEFDCLGGQSEIRIVTDWDDYIRALDEHMPDIVLSEFSIYGYSGIDALREARARLPEVPFVFIADVVEEENAFQALQAGASDYLLKDHIAHLSWVVMRVLRESQQRRELDRALHALRRSEQRYRLLFEHGSDGVALYSLEDGEPGPFIEINDTMCQRLGYTRDELLGMTLADITTPEAICDVRESLSALMTEHRAMFEREHVAKDGSHIPVEVSAHLFDLEGKPTILSIARDITERRHAEEALRMLSLVDEMTGLYNRRGFMTLAEQQLRTARRLGQNAILLFVDVDDLKDINDTLGHLEGDRAINDTAEVLRTLLREADVVSRYGGDEFLALLIVRSSDDEARLVTRVRDAIDTHVAAHARLYDLRVSVGIVPIAPDEPRSLPELIEDADRLMYEDKRAKDATR